jgi:hypothetical protein
MSGETWRVVAASGGRTWSPIPSDLRVVGRLQPVEDRRVPGPLSLGTLQSGDGDASLLIIGDPDWLDAVVSAVESEAQRRLPTLVAVAGQEPPPPFAVGSSAQGRELIKAVRRDYVAWSARGARDQGPQ